MKHNLNEIESSIKDLQSRMKDLEHRFDNKEISEKIFELRFGELYKMASTRCWYFF